MNLLSESRQGGCLHCHQDVIRNCQICMYPAEDGSCLYEPIKKLVIAGAQVGLGIETMIEMLNGGMTITDLVTYIESCRAAN